MAKWNCFTDSFPSNHPRITETFTTPTSPTTDSSLSPLFASSNIKYITSVRARIPCGGKTNITFAVGATNTPTTTVNNGNDSRTISRLFMDEDSGARDDIGIRVSGSGNLSFSSRQSSVWGERA